MLTLMLLRRLSAPAAAFVLSIALSGPVKATTWQQVQPPTAGFSVMFPETPKAGSQPIDTQFGRATMHTYIASASNEAYLASYAVSPHQLDPQRALDGARNGAIQNGRLVSETNISLNGAPGRYIIVSRDGMFFHARIYVIGHRFYQTACGTTSQRLSATAQSFFDSFRLTR